MRRTDTIEFEKRGAKRVRLVVDGVGWGGKKKEKRVWRGGAVWGENNRKKKNSKWRRTVNRRGG